MASSFPIALAKSATIRPDRQSLARSEGERARMRYIRQKLLEEEERIAECEALSMTEAQRSALLASFRAVKFEFTDLDGLSWDAPAARRLLDQWAAPPRTRLAPCTMVRSTPAPPALIAAPAPADGAPTLRGCPPLVRGSPRLPAHRPLRARAPAHLLSPDPAAPPPRPRACSLPLAGAPLARTSRRKAGAPKWAPAPACGGDCT
ncbi:hypothetical protein B0H21DRAFT_712195 [Amylocystis lapponica]|nr:hypothetical protein B0H21DRAFT_712195 [Amylocystis lapponica]